MSQFKALIFNISSDRGVSARSPGSYRIATELRRNEWDTEVVDYVPKWTTEELFRFCDSRITKDTKFVGFSRLFHDHKESIHVLARYIKSKWPHVVTVIGSSFYNSIQDQNIDYYICGYGEQAVIDLLRWKFSNGKMPTIQIVDGDSVIFANDTCSSAPWSDPSIMYEDRDFIMPYEWLTVEFGRGCKFKCGFCDFPFIGVKGDYTRDANNFEIQLKDAHDRFGVSNYSVSDDTFNDRTAKITKFADVVEKLDFEPFFTGYIRPDLLISRPNDREELLRMNFLGHYYGVESLNTPSARSIGKGMESAKVKEGLLEVREYFKTHKKGRYRGTMSMIAGLPHETLETLARTREWLEEYWRGEGVIFFHYALNGKDDRRVSTMTQAPEKYGYSAMTEDEVAQYGTTLGEHYSKNVLWKNKHMDVFQAKEFVKDFNKTRPLYFRLGSFELSNISKVTSVEQRINQYRTDENIARQKKDESQHINEYIRKKLNYSSSN